MKESLFFLSKNEESKIFNYGRFAVLAKENCKLREVDALPIPSRVGSETFENSSSFITIGSRENHNIIHESGCV
jgi:hypothetical protein